MDELNGFLLKVTVLAIVCISAANGEIYRCDSDGVVTYTDEPCPGAMRKDGDDWIDVDEEARIKAAQDAVSAEEEALIRAKEKFLRDWEKIMASCADLAIKSVADEVERVRNFYIQGIQEMVPDATVSEIVNDPSFQKAIKSDRGIKEKYLKVYSPCADRKKPSLQALAMTFNRVVQSYEDIHGELPEGFVWPRRALVFKSQPSTCKSNPPPLACQPRD